MTTTTGNEAAERLRDDLSPAENLYRLWRQDKYRTTAQAKTFIADALAAERRATVERINEAVNGITFEATSASRVHGQLEALGAVQAILDEKAAR